MFENETPKNFDSFSNRGNDLKTTNDFTGNEVALEYAPDPDNDAAAKRAGVRKAVAAVVTSVAGIVLLSTGFMASPKAVSASLENIWTSKSEIGFTVELPDSIEREVSVVIYGDSLKRRMKLSGGENTGVFENLRGGEVYTVTVEEESIFGPQKLLERRVRTKDIESEE